MAVSEVINWISQRGALVPLTTILPEILGSLYQLYRMDVLKDGTLIGEDKYGNKYYQNNRYFVGRSRWIVYNDIAYHMDYDGSQVPPEWYGWLHYKTDLPPTVVRYRFLHLIGA